MQGVKVSLAGQTFALAMCNDSQGKKRRIRRTKEERRVMVESFIKRYRTANSGDFPSLNLTHKEVGGSFYTVREIVREIIGEGGVSSSSNFSSEEHNLDGCSSEEASRRFHGEESQGFMSLSLAIGNEIGDTKAEARCHDSEYQYVTEKPVTVASTYSTDMNFEMVEYTVDQKQTFHNGEKQDKDLMDKECRRESMRAPSEQEKIKEISGEFHDSSIGEGRIKHIIEPLNRLAEASHLLPGNENGGVSVIPIPHKVENLESSNSAGGTESWDLCQTMSLPSSPLLVSDKIDKQSDGLNVIVESDTASETVASDGMAEAKTVINMEIGESPVRLLDQSVPAYVRDVLPLTSDATPAFSLEGGPEDTQTFCAIPEKSHASSMKEERSPALVKAGSAENIWEPSQNLSSLSFTSVCEKEMTHLANPTSESVDCCMTGESLMVGLSDSGKDDQSKVDTDLQDETSDRELQAIIPHNNVQATSLAAKADSTCEEVDATVIKEEEAETEARLGSSSSERGNDSLLTDVKHSGASEQEAMKPKANSIWEVLKSFLAAFIRFWTE